MDLKDLQAQLKIYHDTLNKAVKNRREWENAKNLVQNTLASIIEESGMEAKVITEEKFEGMEVVYIGFGKRESGIHEKIGNTKRPLVKDGGYLTYSQIYNGKISAWMLMPNIERFMDPQAPMPIDIYEPSEITEELIIGHITDFLNAMIEWEDMDAAHHELGYGVKK